MFSDGCFWYKNALAPTLHAKNRGTLTKMHQIQCGICKKWLCQWHRGCANFVSLGFSLSVGRCLAFWTLDQWVCMMAASSQNRWFRILVDLLWLGLFRSNLFSPSPPSRKSANYQQHTLSYLVLSCYSTSIAQYLSLRSSPFSHPSTSSSHVHFPEFSDLWRYEWPGRS